MKRMILLATLLLALLAVLLTGCEKDKPDPGRSGNRPAPNRAGLTGEAFKLRYRTKWLPQAQFCGDYLGQEMGFYQERGLDVEILPGGGDNPSYQSLSTGTADIANLNLITALKYHVDSQPLVNLAQISQKNSTLLIGKKTSGISTIADLRGKKIGVWRDEGGDHIRFFLENLDLGIQIIPIDWSVNLLLNDAIDMMNAMLYNEYHRVLMSGLDVEDLVIFDLADYGFDLVDDGLYATKAFYDAHREQCEDFAAATLEGWVYALEHPEETLEVVLRYQRESYLPANPEHQAWMLEQMRDRVLEDPQRVGCLAPGDLDLANQILIDRGLLIEPVDYQSFHPHENPAKN